MGTYHVTESAEMNLPANIVYGVISDYEVGHPAILPTSFITSVKVLKGGRGAGTAIEVVTAARLGERTLTMDISEPEPGQILEEKIRENGSITRFIVESLGDDRCRVTFDTNGKTEAGFRGAVEALLSPMLLRPIYREEMKLLEAYARRLVS